MTSTLMVLMIAAKITSFHLGDQLLLQISRRPGKEDKLTKDNQFKRVITKEKYGNK